MNINLDDNTQESTIQQETPTNDAKALVLTSKGYYSRNADIKDDYSKVSELKLNNYIKKAQKIIDYKYKLR